MKFHPSYTWLPIYEGPKGERPKMGAFYVPESGETLSKIGNDAGTHWKKINFHTYNLNNSKLIYRTTHMTCDAKKVSTAQTRAQKQAIISMCPESTVQVIWIPPTNNASPKDVSATRPAAVRKTATLLAKKIVPTTAYDAQREIYDEGSETYDMDYGMFEYTEPMSSSRTKWIGIGLASLIAIPLVFVLVKK